MTTTSTFFGFNLARKGMAAQRLALDVTAHNIANASTPGFSRQQAVMATTVAFNTATANRTGGVGQIGTGVNVVEVKRMRDDFLDLQIRPQLSHYGFWEEGYEALSSIETVLMEPGENGLSAIFGRFWDSWQELSKNPTSGAIRTSAVEAGRTLSNIVNNVAAQVETLKSDLDTKMAISVSDINDTTRQIADLNKQIVASEGARLNANDLMDKRDLLLDDLSRMVNFIAIVQPNGAVDVNIGGRHLVQEGRHTELKAGPVEGDIQPLWPNGDKVPVASGRVAGIDAARERIMGFYDELNNMFTALAREVNAAHNLGYDLHGVGGHDRTNPIHDPDHVDFDPDATPPRLDLFVFQVKGEGMQLMDAVSGAEKARFIRFIAINEDIAANPTLIRASDDPLATANGKNSLAIYDIRHKPITIGTTEMSLQSFYGGIISGVGVDGQQAERMLLNQEVLTAQLIQRREEVAGVNLDEEVTNMMQFQHGYQAAARMLATLDELLTTVINLGR